MWVLWVTCLVLTFTFSDLSVSSLLAAFFSWIGGIVTAEIAERYAVAEKVLSKFVNNNDKKDHSGR